MSGSHEVLSVQVEGWSARVLSADQQQVQLREEATHNDSTGLCCDSGRVTVWAGRRSGR